MLMMGSWIVLTAAMVLLAGYSEVSRQYALHLSESRQFRDASEAYLELNLDTGRGVMTLAYAGNLAPRKPIRILVQAFGSLPLGWVEGLEGVTQRGQRGRARLSDRRGVATEASFPCKWARIFSITTGSSMQVRACPASAASALGITFAVPPHPRQVSMSIPNTRFKRRLKEPTLGAPRS
jgi:hypothetical protein